MKCRPAAVRAAGLLLVALLCLFTGKVSAEVRKLLQLESEPAGAQVFLLRGSQRLPLGTTPLRYEAEFHSEMSILRFRFERAGHAGKTLEVPASQDRALARLESRAILAEPGSHRDGSLRQIQQSVNSALADLPAMLGQRPEWGLDVAGLVRVRRLGDGVYLQIPLSIASLGRPQQPDAPLAERAWNGPGKEIASGIRSRVASIAGLKALILEARTDSIDRKFGVSSRVETGVEMVCVAGYRQQFDACVRQVPVYTLECRGSFCTERQTGMRCESGYRDVHDPCATRAPATKSTLIINPSASAGASRARLYMISPLAGTGAEPAMLQLDDSGKTIFSRGHLPDGLVTTVARK